MFLYFKITCFFTSLDPEMITEMLSEDSDLGEEERLEFAETASEIFQEEEELETIGKQFVELLATLNSIPAERC